MNSAVPQIPTGPQAEPRSTPRRELLLYILIALGVIALLLANILPAWFAPRVRVTPLTVVVGLLESLGETLAITGLVMVVQGRMQRERTERAVRAITARAQEEVRAGGERMQEQIGVACGRLQDEAAAVGAQLQRQVTAAYEQLQNMVLAEVDGALAQMSDRISRQVHEKLARDTGVLLVEQRARSLRAHQVDLHNLPTLKRAMGPNLQRVVGDIIDQYLHQVQSAVRNQSIEIIGTELVKFRRLFRRALAEFPTDTFVATSLPSARYFWKSDDHDMKSTFRAFLETGVMKRIFFLKSEESLDDPEVRRILSEQFDMGVEVSVAYDDPDVKTQFSNLLFFVSMDNDLGWELTVDRDEAIKSVVVTTDPDKVERLRAEFRALSEHPCVRRYQKL